MKNLSINAKIAESLLEIYSDSTIHAIPRVIKSKRIPMRIIWTICFLASAGFCSYLIINAIYDYFNYDHVTTVDIYNEMPAKFPYIQICNLNLFQTKKAQDFLSDFIKNYGNILSVFPDSQKYFFLMSTVSSFNKSFQESLSYSIDEILIYCEVNSIKCNSSDFIRVFDSYHGNCFGFNSGKDSNGNSKELINITTEGFLNGFRLELYDGTSNYSRDFIKDKGYVVMIRNQSVNPFNDNDVIVIPSGTSAYIAIDRNYDYRLENPFNDCLSDLDSINSYDSDIFKSFIYSNSTYDQITCFNGCFQKTLIQKCNCSLKSISPLPYNISCSTSEQLSCTSNQWVIFLKSNIFEKCRPDCPARCDSIRYSKTISEANYPQRAYFESSLVSNPVITSKFADQSITYENVKSNVLALNIYYTKLMYTVTSQQPKTTLIDLVSNIGGLLGLFVGMSFLSLVELVEGSFEIIYIFFSSAKANHINDVSLFSK